MNELRENNIHVFEYVLSDSGALNIVVRSYAVFDYIKGVLEGNYKLTPMTLNAADYGAPQKRERFVIVGISNIIEKEYVSPRKKITDENYYTVRDAIADLEDIPAYYEINTPIIHLPPPPDNISELGKKLRGKLLRNHVSTATRETALARFKALKEGQNFHDLKTEMKTTYSNAERTQNTIYMRLVYDEPSGTVVNVRKSMWVHPTLDRAISIREAARLQTFPDTFIFEGTKDAQYQQVGNAVPPILAKAIAKSILKVLDN
jgi:DNA (cytosine-5)-methyltransferase 1